MGTELTAVQYNVTIRFDPAKLDTDPFSYQIDNGPIDEDFKIEVKSNLAVFDFVLWTLTSDPHSAVGRLTTDPLQWLSSSQDPIPRPASFFLSRSTDLTMTLVNLNTVEIPDEKFSFNFEIGVVYQGRTYHSADPTIINVQPPPPVPGTDVWTDPPAARSATVLAS